MPTSNDFDLMPMDRILDWFDDVCRFPATIRASMNSYEELLYEVLKKCQDGKDFNTIIGENEQLSKFYKAKARALAKELAAQKAKEEAERLRVAAIGKLTDEELEVLGLKKKTRTRRAAV